MTWTKTSDDFPEGLLEASDAAYRLHHAATTYCNRLGLDGELPRSRLPMLPVPPRSARPAVVAELVRLGLWEATPVGWTLLDFFPNQPTAEEVRCEREYDRLRQALRFAATDEARAELRQKIDDAKRALFDARERRRSRGSQRDSQRESQRDSHRPVPTRPVPSRKDEDEDGAVTGARGAPDGSTNGRVDGWCQRCKQPIGTDDPVEVRADGSGHPVTLHRLDMLTGRCERVAVEVLG